MSGPQSQHVDSSVQTSCHSLLAWWLLQTALAKSMARLELLLVLSAGCSESWVIIIAHSCFALLIRLF